MQGLLGLSTNAVSRLLLLTFVLNCALLQFSTVICDEVQGRCFPHTCLAIYLLRVDDAPKKKNKKKKKRRDFVLF